MQTKEISLKSAENLLNRYIESGGEVVQVDEGCLGLGIYVLMNNGLKLKEFVIEEYYLSSWSSGHRVKIYTKGLPKKYLKMVERWENCEVA